MSKGGDFEREICKKLSRWLSKNSDDNILWRCDSSGARFTINRKKGNEILSQAGDITYRKEEGKKFIERFCIELKTGYGRKNTKKKEMIRWDILDILDSKQSRPIFKIFWDQVYKKSLEVKKSPLLIFRRNNRNALICMKENTFFKINNKIENYIIINDNHNNKLIIFSLKDFLEKVDPDSFINH